MNLEKAINLIESVKELRLEIYNSILEFDDKLQIADKTGINEKADLQEKLRLALVEHYVFYGFIDSVDSLITLEPPNPKDYGEIAERWLKTEKAANYSFLTIVSGLLATTGSVAATDSFYLDLSFLVVSAIGFLGLTNFRNKSKELKLKEGASDFVKELIAYSAKSKYVSDPKMLYYFEKSFERYSESLEKIVKEGYAMPDMIKPIRKDYTKLVGFRRGLSGAVQAIQKSKKSLLLHNWAGAISSEVFNAKLDLMIEYLKRERDYQSKTISELIV